MYIGLEKYRLASVFEVEHENRFKDHDEATVLKLYKLLITLYEKLGDKLSLETYQKRLKALIKSSKPKEVTTTTMVDIPSPIPPKN